LTTPSFFVTKQKVSVESSAVLRGRQPVPLPVAAAFPFLFALYPIPHLFILPGIPIWMIPPPRIVPIRTGVNPLLSFRPPQVYLLNNLLSQFLRNYRGTAGKEEEDKGSADQSLIPKL